MRATDAAAMRPAMPPEAIGRIIEVSARTRTCRSVEAALDGLLDVGRIIDLPTPTFIDNVADERHHEELQACLGLPGDMLRWWRAEAITAKQRDVQRTRQERMPFVSDLLDGVDAALSPLDRSLREVHRHYGVASNIIVPVHLPSGVTSLVGWTSTEAGAARRVSDAAHGALLAVAYTFIDSLELHKGSLPRAPRRERLSNRERECLRHVAAGCSMKEVAKALALSPYTVREYLDNASRRLGARSLPQLVSLAWQRGEIDGELPVAG